MKSTATGGIGLLTALFLIFATLKIVGVAPVAAWSWWWVTLPLWFIPALVLAVAATAACGVILIAIGGATSDRLRQRSRRATAG